MTVPERVLKRPANRCIAGAFGAAVFCIVIAVALADPAWWSERGVIDSSSAPSEYSPVVLGQLKWMATNAYAEIEENLPNGAGDDLRNLIWGFSISNNYYVANVGQLKYVGSNVYVRLITEGYTNGYPWTQATATDDVDQAIVNLGQLKFVFDFALTNDTDTDSLFDWWEEHYFGSLTNQAGSDDYDSDGYANTNEFLRGSDPTDIDDYNSTIYVDDAIGSDSYDGYRPVVTESHGPKEKIDSGMDTAISGDVIQIAAGTYTNEPGTLNPGTGIKTLRPKGTARILAE